MLQMLAFRSMPISEARGLVGVSLRLSLSCHPVVTELSLKPWLCVAAVADQAAHDEQQQQQWPCDGRGAVGSAVASPPHRGAN